jgi:hypothetical protein
MDSMKASWHCDKCDKTMCIYSMDRQLESKTHKGERNAKLSDVERLEAQMEWQAKYLSKQFYCKACNLVMMYKYRNRHTFTKAHNRLSGC